MPWACSQTTRSSPLGTRILTEKWELLRGGGGRGWCSKYMLRSDGCWVFPSDYRPDQGSGEAEPGNSPAHCPAPANHAKGCSGVV